MSKKSNRYTDEFKRQIVSLYNNGKNPSDILSEYEIARSTLHKWVSNYNATSSFKAADNRSDAEKELIELRKRNKDLEMEVDILKQAALIIAKRSK